MKLEIVFVLYLCGVSSSHKILMMFPAFSGSQVLTMQSMAESLASRGHYVHIVKWKDVHVLPKVNHTNITVTTLSADNSIHQLNFATNGTEAAFNIPSDLIWSIGSSPFSVLALEGVGLLSDFVAVVKHHCETLLANDKLYKILQRERFDVSIIDVMGHECGLALLYKLKIPAVGHWAQSFASFEADYTTAFLPASYIPSIVGNFPGEMNFLERTSNFIFKLLTHCFMTIHFYTVNSAIQKYYPNTPPVQNLLKNLSGMFINADYTLDQPRLLPPTFINIGGWHIQPRKPLTQDLETWIDSSGDDGVVLFTLGALFSTKYMSKALIRIIMNAMSMLPQKFICKFDETIENVPSNVKIVSWVPQQDILAHPKTKAFFTHGGLNGVMESIYHGVPMLAMPFFFDHNDNLMKMKKLGIALGIDKGTTNSTEIYQKLNEILVNPKYKANIDKQSAIMKDTNTSPMDRAAELIEYIVRHKGAEHLKLGCRHLNAIQYFSLDSLAFILLTTFVILKVISKAIKLFSCLQIFISNNTGMRKTTCYKSLSSTKCKLP